MDHAVISRLVIGTETIFHNKQRKPVPVIQPVHGVTKPFRINGPSPLACLHIRIFHPVSTFPVIILRIIVPVLHRKGHVIAESDIIHTACFKRLQVFRCDIKNHPLPFPICLYVFRILSSYMDISKPVAFLHGRHGHHHIFWITGVRINGAHGNHTAELKIRIYLMSCLYCQS